MEEQIKQIKELKNKLDEDYILRTNLMKSRRELEEQHANLLDKIRKVDSNIYDFKKQIEDLENLIKAANCYEHFVKLDSSNLLSEQERVIIIAGMDKKDYTQYCGYIKRWFDLDSIISQVIEIKKDYPDWILYSLKLLDKQDDRYPPLNVYKYTFKTPKGQCFTI